LFSLIIGSPWPCLVAITSIEKVRLSCFDLASAFFSKIVGTIMPGKYIDREEDLAYAFSTNKDVGNN